MTRQLPIDPPVASHEPWQCEEYLVGKNAPDDAKTLDSPASSQPDFKRNGLKNSPLEQSPFLISIKLSPRSDRLKPAGNWLQITVTRGQVT
jgi:hypothetical protein